jgi:eukaryotic-like serine/threonine-protein kinase
MTSTATMEAPPAGVDVLASEPHPGLQLGAYRLLFRLASGGMADVWVANHSGPLGFRRFVAIKTIRPDRARDRAIRTMFLDEARLAARLRHANLVEVLDLGEQGELVYQVMPLVDGESLASLAASWKERLPIAAVLRIVIDGCRGLEAAHELADDHGMPLGLVHRDVSPQNILVGIDGVARVADFGIAKTKERLVEETETGTLRGKYSYLAPEQVDRRALDRRTDVFAMGIVLWECLTGERLFRKDTPEDTLRAVRALAIRDPRERVPGLDRAIAEVTLRALEREPSARFPTAGAMADALEAAARSASIALSSKDVTEVVARAAGPALKARRARMATDPDAAVTVEEVVDRRVPWKRGGYVLLAALAASAGVAGFVLKRRPIEPVASIASSAPADPPPILAETGSAPVPVRSAVAIDSAARRAVPPRIGPKKEAKPRAPFDNPYGR